MKERRRYLRIKPTKPVKARFKVVPGRKQKPVLRRGRSYTRDISGDGMFIELPHMKDEIAEALLSGKNKIVLDLKIPGSRAKVKIVGRAMWMDKKGTARRRTCGVGIRFDEISEHDRERLLQYMLELVLK